MTRQIINVGVADKGNGDPIRTAFIKANANFAELYNILSNNTGGSIITTDVIGSVFADDSTLLVDGINGRIPYSVLSGAPTIPSIGNVGFRNDTVFDLAGLAINNSNTVTDSTAGINIPANGSGVVSIVNNAKTWSFGTDGWLTLPNNGVVQANTIVALSSFNDTNNIARVICQSISNVPQINLRTITSTGAQKDWIFRTDGSLQIPGDIRSEGNINIDINLSDSTLRRWRFGEDGHLTLPTGGDIKDSTGTSVLGGGSVSSLVNGANTVSLGATGTLTVPANGIITAPIAQEFQLQAKDEDSVLRNEINLDPNNGTYMSVWGTEDSASFSTSDWATGSWEDEGGGVSAAYFTNAENLQDFWTTGVGSFVYPIEVSINGGARTPVEYDSNNGETYGVLLLLDSAVPVSSPTNITSLTFYYRAKSSIDIDYNNGQMLFEAQSIDINLETSNNLDLRASQNLNLRGLGAYPVRIYTDTETHVWEFDSAGSLTLPREGKIYGIGQGSASDRYGYISWDGESSGDGSGYNTMRLVPDLQGLEDADQYIIIDPTGGQPGHIHIRAGGTQDNSLADLYLGGEHSHVKISAGENPPVTVMADDNAWIFGTDGAIATSDAFKVNVPSGVPNSVYSYSGGGGWNSPPYTNLATTTNNLGTGLTVNVSTAVGGYIDINAITINTPGTGYKTGDIITITNENNLNGTFLVGVAANTWQLAGGLKFPDNTVQTTAAESFSFSVAADDSTQRAISNNELIKFIGAGGVTTSSDAEGNITITGSKVTGSWTVTAGTSTYSFTLPSDGTYVMWVKGNIANGIITWNATASVTNTNVPAIGSQYAWNYTGGGSPILLTAIPDQIRGSAGTISTDNTYAGSTSNRFDFGISNTSGASQTVYYGYTKI